MAERWIVTVDGATTVLPVTNLRGAVRVVGQETPAPEPTDSWAERTEGALVTSRGWQNRQVTLRLVVERPTDQWWDVDHDFGSPPPEAEGEGTVPGFSGTVRRVDAAGSPIMTAIGDLGQMVGALQTAPGAVAGKLTRVLESGQRIVYDVVSAAMPDAPKWESEVYLRDETELTLRFTCLPFARGQEIALGSASSVAGRRLVTVDDLQVPGDVPALARLELTGATVDQRSVLYAIDQGSGQREWNCSALDRPSSATLTTVAGSVATQVVQRPAFTLAVGAGLWEPGVMLSQSGEPLDVPGLWRVVIRVRGQAGGRVRLRWTSGSRVSGMSTGQPVTLTSDQWELVTLGIVAVPDDAGLDGLIEAALPHDQPIRYDTLLLLPIDVLGEQHATQSTLPREVLASDPFAGTGALAGSVAPAGGTWGSVGAGATATRNSTFAARIAASSDAGRSHGLGIGSPAGAVVSAAIATSSGGAGDGGIWIGNALGEAAIAGSSGASGNPGSGAPGAWGIYAAARGWGSAIRWWLVIINGTEVTAQSSALVTGSGGVFELTMLGPRVQLRVLSGSSSVLWSTSVDVTPPPGSLRAGIASHGWTVAAETSSVIWIHFNAMSVPLAQDAALFAGESSRHASGGASRVDAAGIRGPVVPDGARPVLPASGGAARPTRVAVMTTRGDLRQQIDAGPTDPVTVDVYATPRYLQVPR